MNIDKLSWIRMLENLTRDYKPDYTSCTDWELQSQLRDEISVVINKIGVREGRKLFLHFLQEKEHI